jgi:nicotinamidase-related amidase
MRPLRFNIDAARAVHLCLDMQSLFGPSGPWPTLWLERVLPNVVSLVAHDPARTIFTRFMPPEQSDEAVGMWRLYFKKWSKVTRSVIDPELLDLLPALRTLSPPALVFDKPAYSAFSNPQLHAFLQEKQVYTLVVSGTETDVCVLATVLAAVDLGYRVIVAKDALCSSADQMHDALITLYAQRYDLQIELADCREIIEAWAPTL